MPGAAAAREGSRLTGRAESFTLIRTPIYTFIVRHTMILFRYLSRQVLQVVLAVSLILLIVAFVSRIIQYLGDVVAGQLASDVLLLLIFYRLPEFLLVILPLSLFLGILLAYGRMYAENEMVVLLGSGTSPRRLLALTMGSGCIVLLCMVLLSLWLMPWGMQNSERLKQSQEQLTEVDLIVAGQFQRFGGGSRVTHAEQVTRGTVTELENIFVAVQGSMMQSGAVQSEEETQSILLAESATPEIDAETGARFMRLENVVQYDGIPGSREFTIGQSGTQLIRLPDAVPLEDVLAAEEKALPTSALLGATEPERQAELQWRLSNLLLVPIIILIAVPLSKVAPHHGRYNKLVPAGLLYVLYYVLLQISRDLLADGSINAAIGLWWVHILFIGLGVLLYRKPELSAYLSLGKSKS
ncbi:MAG: LPS export ABC transporter permease LptF [Pseudohongiellaceae bacterium]